MLFNQLYLFWQIEHEYTCFRTVFFVVVLSGSVHCAVLSLCKMFRKLVCNRKLIFNITRRRSHRGKNRMRVSLIVRQQFHDITGFNKVLRLKKSLHTQIYQSWMWKPRFIYFYFVRFKTKKNLFLSCLSRILLFQYLWELIYKMTWFKAKRFNERRLSFFPLCLIPSSSNWFLSFARSQCVCVHFNSNRCIGSE